MRGIHGHDSRPERPRYEPEILPPAQTRPDGERPGDDEFVFVDQDGFARRYSFRPPGPVGIILALALLGLVAAAGLLMLLGFVLVWIPATIALIAGVALAGSIRRLGLSGLWRGLSWRGRRRP